MPVAGSREPGKSPLFHNLIVYQSSKALVKEVYGICNRFPKTDFALKNQLQKAAISVPANIAEGQERPSFKEKIRFLYIARASLAEVEVYFDIARDLKYIDRAYFNQIMNKIGKIGKLINGLINSHALKANKTAGN